MIVVNHICDEYILSDQIRIQSIYTQEFLSKKATRTMAQFSASPRSEGTQGYDERYNYTNTMSYNWNPDLHPMIHYTAYTAITQ